MVDIHFVHDVINDNGSPLYEFIKKYTSLIVFFNETALSLIKEVHISFGTFRNRWIGHGDSVGDALRSSIYLFPDFFSIGYLQEHCLSNKSQIPLSIC
ncbi:hypothetical protein CEXT_525151 [Caerostris extrusa]|uniref:Uncharacterized protein n=1 Tax=Caerostris extrusa TaxID=172846 RepID=A0AAV4VGX0_CAEEX|nr:hypothetical protein CEXT_525151 [Caerostris extrusa]